MAPNLDISHPLFPSPQQINRTMIDCNSIHNNDVDVDVDYDVVTRRGNISAVVPSSLIYGTPTTTTAVDIAKSHIGMKNKPVSSVSPKQGPLEKRIRLRRFPEQSLLNVINAEKGQRYLTAAPPSPPLPPPLLPPPLMSPPELKRVSANYWLSSPNHQLLFDQHQSFVSYCASEERRWSSKSSTKCPQLATMDDNDDGNDDGNDDDDDDDLRSPLEYQDTIQQQVMNNNVENEVEIELETKIGNESRSKRTKSNNNKTTTMWLMSLVETTNIPIFDLQVQALTSTMKLGLASTVSKVRECRFATVVDHRAKFCLPEYSDEDNNNEGEVGGDDNNEGQELQQGKGKWWAHSHINAVGGKQQQQQQQMRPPFHPSSSISVVTPTPPPKNYHRSSLALSPPLMLVDKALAMMTIPVSPILPRKYAFGDNNSTTTTAYAKAVKVLPRFPSMSEYHHQQEQHSLPGDLLMPRTCHAKGGLSKQTCLFPKVDQVHKHIDGPSPNERQPPSKNYDSSNSVVAAAAPNNNVASNDDIGIPSAASRPPNNNSITMTSQQQLCGNG